MSQDGAQTTAQVHKNPTFKCNNMPTTCFALHWTLFYQGVRCDPHHTTLIFPLSSKVTTTHQIQQWHKTIKSIKQTIKIIHGCFYTPSTTDIHYPNHLWKAIQFLSCQTPQMIPRTIYSQTRFYALKYAQLCTLWHHQE